MIEGDDRPLADQYLPRSSESYINLLTDENPQLAMYFTKYKKAIVDQEVETDKLDKLYFRISQPDGEEEDIAPLLDNAIQFGAFLQAEDVFEDVETLIFRQIRDIAGECEDAEMLHRAHYFETSHDEYACSVCGRVITEAEFAKLEALSDLHEELFG